MKFAASAHKLLDGKEVIVRNAVPEDAGQLLQLKLGYIKDTTTIPLFEDEYPHDVPGETKLIQRYLDEPNSILLVAEHDGRLVGNIDLTGSQRRKLYHTGMIGMGISYEWQNKGIGHLLLQNVLLWAAYQSPLSIIWLEVYSGNEAGLKLYKKNGFACCGEIQGFFGNEHKLTMVKYLKS